MVRECTSLMGSMVRPRLLSCSMGDVSMFSHEHENQAFCDSLLRDNGRHLNQAPSKTAHRIV